MMYRTNLLTALSVTFLFSACVTKELDPMASSRQALEGAGAAAAAAGGAEALGVPGGSSDGGSEVGGDSYGGNEAGVDSGPWAQGLANTELIPIYCAELCNREEKPLADCIAECANGPYTWNGHCRAKYATKLHCLTNAVWSDDSACSDAIAAFDTCVAEYGQCSLCGESGFGISTEGISTGDTDVCAPSKPKVDTLIGCLQSKCASECTLPAEGDPEIDVWAQCNSCADANCDDERSACEGDGLSVLYDY